MKYITIKDSQIRFEKQVRFIALATIGITLFGIGYGKGISEEISLAKEINEPTQIHIEPVTKDLPTKKEVKEDTPTPERNNGVSTSNKRYEKRSATRGKKTIVISGNGTRSDLAGIKKVYSKYATKTLNKNIDWLYQECIKRGLSPSLVFAVQAKESGWGKSYYCTNHKNCFGYGYTDSGKVGNYHGESYREVTSRILDKYKKQGYGMVNAKTMAERGYNFHPEWIVGVNEIQSWFK